jgi:hypothetical protein
MASNKKNRSKRPFPTFEVAVFYDAAADHPSESFEKTTKWVVPRSWKSTTAAFKKEARKMYDLAR